MKETLISSFQMADEVVRSPNFLLVRPSPSHLLTDERPVQNCGSLAIPPRHRRKLTRTTCITRTSGLSCQCKTNAMYNKTYFNFMCFSVMFIIGIIADEELEVIIDAADIVEDIIIYDEPLPKLPK